MEYAAPVRECECPRELLADAADGLNEVVAFECGPVAKRSGIEATFATGQGVDGRKKIVTRCGAMIVGVEVRNRVAERRAGHVLQAQAVLSAREFGEPRVNLHDVVVLEVRERQPFGCARHGRVGDLERHLTVERNLLREKDRSQPALAEFGQQHEIVDLPPRLPELIVFEVLRYATGADLRDLGRRPAEQILLHRVRESARLEFPVIHFDFRRLRRRHHNVTRANKGNPMNRERALPTCTVRD